MCLLLTISVTVSDFGVKEDFSVNEIMPDANAGSIELLSASTFSSRRVCCMRPLNPRHSMLNFELTKLSSFRLGRKPECVPNPPAQFVETRPGAPKPGNMVKATKTRQRNRMKNKGSSVLKVFVLESKFHKPKKAPSFVSRTL